MKIGFIGAGKVGFSLGKYFSAKGTYITGYYSKNVSSAIEAANFTHSKYYDNLRKLVNESSIIFLTTPDDVIPLILEEIKNYSIKNKIFCHCSGSISSKIFSNINNSGAYGYSTHPMYAFSDKYNSYKNLNSAYFSIEGDTNYLYYIKNFIESLGNKTLIIKPEDKTLYHLANVTASNLVLSLLNISASYLKNCGISEEDSINALMPLIENNILNIKNSGFFNSITGPIDRNDIGTIKHHVKIIPKEDLLMYKTLCLNLLKLVKEKYPTRSYDELYEFLGGI